MTEIIQNYKVELAEMQLKTKVSEFDSEIPHQNFDPLESSLNFKQPYLDSFQSLGGSVSYRELPPRVRSKFMASSNFSVLYPDENDIRDQNLR